MLIVTIKFNYVYQSHRKFYNELALHETSLEGICSTFVHHGAEFKCYVAFLSNLDRGLHILSSFGGSFFTDKQEEIGDGLSLVERYSHPRQRLIDYDRSLKEVYMCSQKEYLHGVSMVKVRVRVIFVVNYFSVVSLRHLSPSSLCIMPSFQSSCLDNILVCQSRHQLGSPT